MPTVQKNGPIIEKHNYLLKKIKKKLEQISYLIKFTKVSSI